VQTISAVNQYMTPVASSPTQYAVAINRPMAHKVGRRRLTEEVPVLSQANPDRICGVQTGTTTGFSPSTLFLPGHSRSTNCAYTFINLSQML
jgi:hypothetical protein